LQSSENKDEQIESRMKALMIEEMKRNDCPEEQFARMGL
jgi:hypothetical protein